MIPGEGFTTNDEDVIDSFDLNKFPHLKSVGADSPNFRVQMKVHYPERKITIKHEFLKERPLLTGEIDDSCITPLAPFQTFEAFDNLQQFSSWFSNHTDNPRKANGTWKMW